MEMRGRNRKWLRTGDGRTVGKVGLIVVFKFSPGIRQCRGRNNALVVVNVIECSTGISQHKRIGGENRSRSGRGSVNGKEGVDCRELVADFFFLNVEKASNVFNHLLMGKSHLVTGRTVRRRRGNNVRGVATAIDRGQGVGRNENGGRGAGHCWDGRAVVRSVKGKKQV